MRVLLYNASGHITIERMLPYWKDMGHQVTSSIDDKCNVNLAYVNFGSRTNLPKVLRLDGIYYDSDTNYNDRNKSISDSHSMADAVIYQSDYSRLLIEKYLKNRKKGAFYDVIYNGINPGWAGEPIEHDGINITVTSKWRRHKRLKEIIELFFEFHSSFPNSKLHIFGLLHDNQPVRNKHVIYYGMQPRNNMLKVIRMTDFSLHLSKRDSCPNSVVEYIGAGIPTITTNNCGGSTEICSLTPGCVVIDGDGDYNDLSPVPHYRDKWNALPPEVSSGILSAMKKLAEDRTRVELPTVLTAKYMAERYIKVMEGLT